VVFLFAIELVMEMRVINDYYIDGCILTIIILLIEFISCTERISLLVKLFNSVVLITNTVMKITN